MAGADAAGRVVSITINAHKVLFELNNGKMYRLFSEAPNTKTIPQFELAAHSWMLSVLQTAYTTGKILAVWHDEDRTVSQIMVMNDLNFKELTKNSSARTKAKRPAKPKTKGK